MAKRWRCWKKVKERVSQCRQLDLASTIGERLSKRQESIETQQTSSDATKERYRSRGRCIDEVSMEIDSYRELGSVVLSRSADGERHHYVKKGTINMASSSSSKLTLPTSTVTPSYVIETLTGTNFATWRDSLKLALGVMELDHALRFDPPEALNDKSTTEQKLFYDK
ncbi:hypothetical protein LXL04_020658 [Taraxacum kok-saghyz]